MQTKSQDIPAVDPIVVDDPTPTTETADETATESTDTTVADNSTDDTNSGFTSVPDPETGVKYRVQIAAGPNTVGKTYFRSRHNYAEKFNIENHKGYVKYTTGSFAEYKQARDDRERIRKSYNFNGPFVTAYNEGDRITVQEALMITQQKWYQ